MAPAGGRPGGWAGIREDLAPLRRRDGWWIALAAPAGLGLFAWRASAAAPALLAPSHPIDGAAWVVAAVGCAGWGALSAVLALIDVRVMRLPNRLLGVTALWLLGWAASAALLSGDPSRFGWAGLLAAGAAVLCALLWLASPRALGGGDVKLAPLCVFAAAWLDPGSAVLVLPVAVALAAVAAVGAGLRRAAAGLRRAALPFGPPLIAASWLAIALPVSRVLGG